METNSSVKRKAISLLRGNWGTAIILSLVLVGINFLISLIGDRNDPVEVAMRNYFITSLLSVLASPVTFGIDWAFLNLTRGEEFTVKTVLEPINVFLKCILAALLQWVFIGIGLLLFIVPGIIIGISLSQVSFILKDNPELSTTDVLILSRKMMKGYKWQYFKLMFSFIGWVLLCILSIGIGFLWLTPYIAASQAEFYNNLKGIYVAENNIL